MKSEARSWVPKKLDLVLSLSVGILLPFAANLLLVRTGALIPMLLYYGLAWGVVIWRRGGTGYGNPLPKKITLYFWFNLVTIVLCLVCAYGARRTFPSNTLTGVLFTALVWAPVNASSEQLLWIYLFESWERFPARHRVVFVAVGVLLFAFFVGMIHAMYWGRFLHTVEPGGIFGVGFILLTTVSGFLHVVVWKKTGNMLFTFIPHFLLNLAPLFWTNYSILPYLVGWIK